MDTLKAFFNINHDSSVIDVRLIDGFSNNVQEFERVLSSGSLESNPLPAASPEPSTAPGAASSEPSDRTVMKKKMLLAGRIIFVFNLSMVFLVCRVFIFFSTVVVLLA